MPKVSRPTNRKPAAAPAAAARAAQPADARWFEITNLAEAGVAEIRLRGYIGEPQFERDWFTGELVRGTGAGTLQEFEAELGALGDVREIQLSIFSEGGEVFTGMAIANLLQRHPAHKVCIIDGICASAATYPALACDEVRIPSNAWMMIHGSEGCCCGGAGDMRSYADMLDQINATAVNLYVARTGKSESEISAMLQKETWMDGRTAAENGFADTVIEPLQNLAARAGTLQPTNAAMLRAAPAEVLALFDMSRIPKPANTAHPSIMLKPRSPLMNAAETGGAAAPAAGAQPTNPPAAAPEAPGAPPIPAAAPAAAPTNVVQPSGAPAAPPTASPTNVIQLTQEQLQGMLNQAATNAAAPLQARLEVIEGQRKAGISPENLAGGQPVFHAMNDDGQRQTMTPQQFAGLDPYAQENFFRAGGRIKQA